MHEALPGTIIARNTGIGFDYVNLNTRLNRTLFLKESLRIDLSAEAFNALNHRNNEVPDATFGTAPSHRASTSPALPLQMPTRVASSLPRA